MKKPMKQPEVDMKAVEAVIERHRGGKWGLIPLLEEVQEQVGYVPPQAVPRIAEALKLFPSQIQGVISFYSQLYSEPRGRNVVKVCRGTACHVRGGKSILKLVKQHLGIDEGETTEDMEYTLETVACIGVCALAPNIAVNNRIHGAMNPGKVAAVFQKAKGGDHDGPDSQ